MFMLILNPQQLCIVTLRCVPILNPRHIRNGVSCSLGYPAEALGYTAEVQYWVCPGTEKNWGEQSVHVIMNMMGVFFISRVLLGMCSCQGCCPLFSTPRLCFPGTFRYMLCSRCLSLCPVFYEVVWHSCVCCRDCWTQAEGMTGVTWRVDPYVQACRGEHVQEGVPGQKSTTWERKEETTGSLLREIRAY